MKQEFQENLSTAIPLSSIQTSVSVIAVASVRIVVSHSLISPLIELKTEKEKEKETQERQYMEFKEQFGWMTEKLLKVETVLGMIYMSIRVLIRLRGRDIHAVQWRISHVILVEHIVLVEEALVFYRAQLI